MLLEASAAAFEERKQKGFYYEVKVKETGGKAQLHLPDPGLPSGTAAPPLPQASRVQVPLASWAGGPVWAPGPVRGSQA